MSRGTKIILGVIVGCIILCICLSIEVGVLLRSAAPIVDKAVSITEDEKEIAQIASDIVDYELPPDYLGQIGMSFFSFDIVGFGPPQARGPMIILMQIPQGSGMSQAQMEQQLHQSLQRQGQRQDMNLEVVDQITTTIRDQTVVLTIREGADDEHTPIRQVSGVFFLNSFYFQIH